MAETYLDSLNFDLTLPPFRWLRTAHRNIKGWRQYCIVSSILSDKVYLDNPDEPAAVNVICSV